MLRVRRLQTLVLVIAVIGLLNGQARAAEPTLTELQHEWSVNFPAQPDKPLPIEPAPTPTPYSIMAKEFLLIRPFEIQPAMLSRPLQTIRDYPLPLRQAHAACVKIITASWHGAGVVISAQGEILTSYHLVAGATGASIITIDGRVYSVTNILAHSAVHDLALLKIPAETPVFLPVNTGAYPTPGQSLSIVGHPANVSWKKSSGTTLRHVQDIGTRMLQFDSDIGRGNSGGPIIDEEGHLCAITACSAQLADGSNVKVGVDLEAITDFLNAPRHPASFTDLAALDKNRRAAEFLEQMYIVMETWMRQWMAVMASVTLETDNSALSPSSGVKVLRHRQAGAATVKLLLLHTLLARFAETRGLDPQLYQSIAATTAAVDHLIDGAAAVRPYSTAGQLRQILADVSGHRDQAKLCFGKGLATLEQTVNSFSSEASESPQLHTITELRACYLPAGCHFDD